MFNDNTKGTDTIGAFNRHADGTLTPEAGSPFAAGGAGTGTGLADQGAIQITPDGRFLIAADAGCCRLFTSAKCGPGKAQHRWSRRRADSRADPRTAAAVPAWPAIKTLSTTGSRLPTLADARQRAPNLAWTSYLNRPCGMAGVTSAEPFRELPGNGGKHVPASAAMPGMARTRSPRSMHGARNKLAAMSAELRFHRWRKACSHTPQKSFAPTKRTRTQSSQYCPPASRTTLSADGYSQMTMPGNGCTRSFSAPLFK